MQFSLSSLQNALQRALGGISSVLSGIASRIQTGIQRPGGVLGPSSLMANLGYTTSEFRKSWGKLPTFYESGRVAPAPRWTQRAEASGPEVQLSAQRFERIGPYSVSPSTVASVTSAPPTPQVKTTTPAPKVAAPIPTVKPPETTIKPAPVAGVSTPPTPTMPASTSAPSMVGIAGLAAPTPTGLPPAPTLPAERMSPTAENLSKFAALIRALQELQGGGAYVPMPLTGTQAFGPAGALEKALRRIRERELRV